LKHRKHTNSFWINFLQLGNYQRLQPLLQHSIVEYYEELTLDDLFYSMETFRLIDTERMWISKGTSGPLQSV